jgi:hypothetical protein
MDAAGKQIQTKIDSARVLFAAIEKLANAAERTPAKKDLRGSHDLRGARGPSCKPDAGLSAEASAQCMPCEPGESSSAAVESCAELRVTKKHEPPGDRVKAILGNLQAELVAQEVRYALSTGHLFLKAATGGEGGRVAAREEFMRVVASEDFAGSIDRLVGKAEVAVGELGIKFRTPGSASAAKTTVSGARRALSKSKALATERKIPARASPPTPAGLVDLCADTQKLLDSYPRALPPGPNIRHSATSERLQSESSSSKSGSGSLPARVDYEWCIDCNAEMVVDPDRSELRCLECGALRPLDGTVFDDAQFYSQEGQKAKSGTFNPNRHFQHWWTHIYAREPEEEIGDVDDPENQYGEKTLEKMRAIVRRDRKILRLLTVNDVRGMLRELGLTELNKNVALIMKKLTGIGPPTPSDQLSHKVEKYFSKAIEIGESVKRDGRVNRNYYPIYVMKLLDALLPPDDRENRRVLYYIYLQSDDTLTNDDLDWQLICADPEMNGIKYVPTDRTMPMKYQPL